MELQAEPSLVSPALIEGLNKGEIVVSDVGATIPGVSPANFSRFLLDLAHAVAGGGGLNPEKLAVAIKSSGVEVTPVIGQDLADALWYVWQQWDVDAAAVDAQIRASEDAKTRLSDATKEALKEQLFTKAQLMECCDGDFLEWCGLVVSKDVWRKKEVRVHTKHVYQQRKFNLLREESEGYAKLATLLNQQAGGCITTGTTAAVMAEMKALIGYFDLDPNRCFSVLLDAFTQQPHNDAFLGIMPAFSADACSQLLGFHFFRCREDAAAQRACLPAPPGLYVAAAKMVRAGYTTLQALMAHLLPLDDDLRQAYSDGYKKMAAGISRIGIISLVSAADNAAPLAPPGLGLRRESSGAVAANAAAAAAAEQPRARLGQTAAALELAAVPYAAPLAAIAAGNQKLLLLAAFLQIGDWEHAQQLMRWLRALGLADFAVFPAVGEALCTLIGRELQPVYVAATAGKPAAALHLPPRLLQLLAVAGQHLYHNMTVLTKLVRVLAAVVAANGPVHPVSKQQHEQVLELLTQSVLPSMNLIPGNAALVYEIWAAIEKMPYTDRFCLYADLQVGAKASPLLQAAAKLAETEVRRILRRVTAPANKKEAKQTMKPLGRMLAKIMHANPLAVAEQLIRQVMGMPGMVTSIVESLKYLTPMAFDVMTFAVLKQLGSPKKKLKDDGQNLEEWYQWLAAFTGLLCKKHGEVEVVCLLQYVANQLKSCESLDLLVLKEMVQTMTGHQAVFEVGEHQLDALAGSDTLKAEVITQGEHRSSDKSMQRASGRLLAALMQGEKVEERLAMPLLILLAQQRKLIVLQSQSTHLKLIAELYDKCQEVCTQYAEFLQHALPTADYRALLPSMEDLAQEYCIDPEIIFSLYRPLIHGIEPPAAPGGDHEEEGEISTIPPPPPAAAGGGEQAAAGSAQKQQAVEAMDEDGQLEAGEVQASPGGKQRPPAAAAAVANGLAHPPQDAEMAQRWQQLEQQVRAMHGGGERPWRGLSPTLYTTFWALQLYDLEVPVARYESTIAQLRTDIRITQGDLDSAKRDMQRPPPHYAAHGGGAGAGGFGFRGPPPPPEVALGPAVDVDQLQKDLERSQAALDKLPGELKAQQANAAAVEQRLQREKGGWVVVDGPRGLAPTLPREFVQHCVLPRMLNSPADALYCARFLKKVHQLDVPAFNLLNTINSVMREFGFLVRVCTSREATNFGIFLNEVFAMVERWRQPEVFARDCASAATFRVVSDKEKTAKPAAAAAAAAAATAAGGVPAASAGAGGTAVAAGGAAPGAAGVRNVSHLEFVNLCYNWQKKLTDEVFTTCLKSRDYMQGKNALLALNRCVKVYPATRADASCLIELLKPIRDKDPREDLKTLARMYCTALEMQMRDKTRAMVDTREEYAGRRPLKRASKPSAASKAGAPLEGKPPAGEGAAAAAAAGSERKGGREGAATPAAGGGSSGGSGKAAAAAAAGGGEKDKAATAAAVAAVCKEEVRRTTDSSKGPSLPPGMGVARRGEQPQAGRAGEQSRREERRREERPSAAQDGPPPGFGSADKLKHAGSTSELRRAGTGGGGDLPPAGADRRERQQERRGGGGTAAAAERPPRPSGREEQQREKEPLPRDKEQQPAERERSRGGGSLRPEAAAFVPKDGVGGSSRLSSGSARGAEEPGAGEREAKRPRREDAPAAAAGDSAAGGGGRAKERGDTAQHAQRERGERPSAREAAPLAATAGAGRERERVRERPSSKDAAAGDAAVAAAAAAGNGRGERPRSGSKDEQKGAAAEAGSSRAARPRSGSKDKPVPAAAGAAAAAAADTGRDRHRERPSAAADRPASGGKEGGRAAAAAAAADNKREEEARRDSGKRKRDEEQQRLQQQQQAAQPERPSSRGGDSRERQPPQPVRERERERASSREVRAGGGAATTAAAAGQRERSVDGRRPHRRESDNAAAAAALVDVANARAAAKAAAAAAEAGREGDRQRREEQHRGERGASHRHAPAAAVAEEQQQLQAPRSWPELRAPPAAAATAAASVGGSSGSDDDRSRGRGQDRRKDKKEKRKKEKDRKDKKHRRKDRSGERGAPSEPSPQQQQQLQEPPPQPMRAPERRQPIPTMHPAPAPAAAAVAPAVEEEPDTKRRRKEEAPDLPARLRGRLGSSLLGAALKDIAPDSGGSGANIWQQQQREEAQHEPQHREQQHSEQQQQQREGGSGGGVARRRRGGEPLPSQLPPPQEQQREVREVREVRDSRDGRRGGRSARR